MNIQTGLPTVEGRYVIWTPCASPQVRQWCEPSIATWHGGQWHSRELIYGWVGPLPVVHTRDPLKPRKHVYFKCAGTEAKCIEGRCVYCDGGLDWCTVCKQAEGELELTCPGMKADYDL